MLFIGEAEEVVMRAMGVIGRRGEKNEKGGKSERAGLEGKRGLEAIARQTGVSKSYLCRVFKKTMGMTVGEYIREFEKVGEGFVDEILMEAEKPQVLDVVQLPKAVDQCRREGWDVRSDSIEDPSPPEMSTELDYGQWICTEDLTNTAQPSS